MFNILNDDIVIYWILEILKKILYRFITIQNLGSHFFFLRSVGIWEVGLF